MKKLAIFIIAGVLAMVMLVPGASGSQKKKDNIKLTVAELRSEFWLPAYLAETLGYYKDEGLEITFITTKDGPVAFQGMHAGSADFTMLSTEPVFRAQARGLESTIIMSTLTSKPYMLIGSPDITDVKQLKGKTIFAGMPGSAPHSFALAILEKAGMKGTDVKWAQMEYGASLGALERGHIDASYLRSTAKNAAAAIGANILVDVSDPAVHKEIYGTSRYESSIITGTKKFVRDNPEAVQKFANAVIRAMIWIQDNSDEDVAKMAAGLFPAGSVTVESIGYLRPSLSKDGFISKEGHETIVAFCLSENIIDRDIAYDEVYDMSFIKNAYKKNK